MRTSRFDMAVIGDSLAARMAAALLAKHGKRLLLLSSPCCHDPWLHTSLFLEKLLATLGGRSCFAAFQPFQVISASARVTIQPELPLTSELEREFGASATPAVEFLNRLEQFGRSLEELLWVHGGLPSAGVSAALRWRWLCLRRKFPMVKLEGALLDRLQDFPEPVAEWLTDLFQGLSLQPVASLAIVDGALLWASARRTEGICGHELQQLLKKRLEQFHGIEKHLEALESLEYRGGQWIGTLHDGGRFQAGQLLLADLGCRIPGNIPPLPQRAASPPGHFMTTPLNGRISALLERQVITGGSAPLRLTVKSVDDAQVAHVSSSNNAVAEQLHRQLEPVFPFARYALEPLAKGHAASADGGTPALPSIFRLPYHAGSHTWCADESRLLPHLGLGGAALLAWTLARHIDPSVFPRDS